MIEQITYRCDNCKTRFLTSPWVLGVSRDDKHFCTRPCREAWSASQPDDDEPDIIVGRVPTIRRGLGDVSAFCQALVKDGAYAGFFCCEPLAHVGKHAIRLHARPEMRVYEWETQDGGVER